MATLLSADTRVFPLPRRSFLPAPRLLLALALALVPLTTPLTFGARTNEAVTATPLLLLTLLGVAALGIRLWTTDRWLGAFVVWTAGTTWRTHEPGGVEMAVAIGIGAWLLGEVRTLAADDDATLRDVLALVAVVIAGYALLQSRGIDPLWPDRVRVVLDGDSARFVTEHSAGVVHGLFGNTTWLGAGLAILLPLTPPPCWVVLLPALVLSKSVLGMLAAAVALLIRLRMPGVPRWVFWLAMVGLPTAAAGACAWVLLHRVNWPFAIHGTWHGRWTVWRYGLDDMLAHPWSLLLGRGEGAWATAIPLRQQGTGYPVGELYGQAHSDLLQLVHAGGLVSLILLAGWLWTHRGAFRRATPWTAAVAALALTSLGMFPWRVPTLAALGLLVLGRAIPSLDKETPA